MSDIQKTLPVTDQYSDIVDAEDLNESYFDVEMGLFALSAQQDVGEATEDLHLDQLSASEKRILLAYMRQRLGSPLPTEETTP